MNDLVPNAVVLNKDRAILAGAEARRATEKREDLVARRRWQTGWLIQRGKKNSVWVGRYREDVIAADGTRRRRQSSVVLGPVRDINKRQAQRMLSAQLAAINQGTHKPQMMVSFEQFVLEHWEPNILPTLRPGTVRNYQQVIRTHLLPFFGQMRLPEIVRTCRCFWLENPSK